MFGLIPFKEYFEREITRVFMLLPNTICGPFEITEVGGRRGGGRGGGQRSKSSPWS